MALILPTVASRETAGRNDYATQAESAHTRMAAQERSHARVLTALMKRSEGAEGSELARVEGRHRNVGGNALRAAVLGANDGLCSNLALVMGVSRAAVRAPTGGLALALSITLSGLALFGIGAAITIFTGRSGWRSGLRQLVLGLAAAGLTYGLGKALDVALG